MEDFEMRNALKIANIKDNLVIKQLIESDFLAYNKEYLAKPVDDNFNIIKAFEGTEKEYARLTLAIKNNNCMDETCQQESAQLLKMQQAPQVFLEFIQNLTDELATTEDDNFDPNNDVAYTIANCILSSKPGFSRNQGYNIVLNILEDGTQEMVFWGGQLPRALIINSSTLNTLLQNETYLITPTPDIPTRMKILLTEIGLFDKKMIDAKTKFLMNNAKILEEFVLKNPDGSAMYEVVEIGNGMARNIVKYDLDKIQRKANPFLDADVAGLMSSEQGVIAAWNVYIAKGTSAQEDAQMAQDANAWGDSWTYEDNLPLTQTHKDVFIQKYKEYFSKNYLYSFTENQLPYVKEDAAVFSMAKVKKDQAQKFLDDNDLN
jgi:hypothetical protein|tara:strand:- start:3374 stop:4501 length:1128 start_codon:yes stop_codon:yes gene_type:complete